MSTLQVFHATQLIILLCFTVRGTSQEVSFTRGDTAKIPCPLGEDPILTISWYYTNASAPQRILTGFKGIIMIIKPSESYAYRAELDKDDSTLILKNISVKDEGTYSCELFLKEKTLRNNINTRMNVYGLAPNTSPNIHQCSERSSNCSFTAKGPTDLTCELNNVYPTSNVLLEWYPEGHGDQDNDFSISQAHEDGTFDLINMLKVPRTGNWTCKAVYISTEGMEITRTSVFVTIIESKDGAGSGTNLGTVIVPVAVVMAAITLVSFLQLLRWRQNHRRLGRKPSVEITDNDREPDKQVGNIKSAIDRKTASKSFANNSPPSDDNVEEGTVPSFCDDPDINWFISDDTGRPTASNKMREEGATTRGSLFLDKQITEENEHSKHDFDVTGLSGCGGVAFCEEQHEELEMLCRPSVVQIASGANPQSAAFALGDIRRRLFSDEFF